MPIANPAPTNPIGDVRLLLMAALMLIDEQKDAERRIEALEAHIDRLRNERHGAASLQAAFADMGVSGVDVVAITFRPKLL